VRQEALSIIGIRESPMVNEMKNLLTMAPWVDLIPLLGNKIKEENKFENLPEKTNLISRQISRCRVSSNDPSNREKSSKNATHEPGITPAPVGCFFCVSEKVGGRGLDQKLSGLRQ
jgi:hypothetical protein